MKWLWERSDEQKRKDTVEFETVQRNLKSVMAELQKTLEVIEADLDKGLMHDQRGFCGRHSSRGIYE